MKKFSMVSFQIIIIVLTLVFLMVFFNSNEMNSLFISLLFLYVFCLLSSFTMKKVKVFYLFFLLTFFLFLLGQYTFLFFTEDVWWGNFDISIIKITIYSLMLSLIGIFIGYHFSPYLKGFFIKKRMYKETSNNFIFISKLKKISKIVFWITFFPALYTVIDQIIFSQTYGYQEVYLSYSSDSVLLSRLSILNKVSFFMFLATFPTKKESKLIISVFFIFNFSTLFVGSRGDAVSIVLVILFYFLYRNRYDSKLSNGEMWISKKTIITTTILAPIFILFLSFWSYFRSGISIENIDYFELFFGFFKSQGGSVHIISHVQNIEYLFPGTNISYTFGPVINFFKYNIFISLFADFPSIQQHTLEAALYGNNMSQTITYLVMPDYYFAGGGMGSSYIAEVLYDYNLIGVFLFNILVGVLIYNIDNFNSKKPWKIVIYFIIFESILTLPRNVALSWFVDVFNITTIGSILILYLLAKSSSK